VIPRYFVVAERDHELQNPISVEKLVLLGERLRLGPGSRVIDIASGRGGPALLLARSFGCSVEGIEVEPEFHAASCERARAEGLDDRLSFRLADARPKRSSPAPTTRRCASVRPSSTAVSARRSTC
jgi:cyclopropane fatty-acyl-phospholipid synthase-like methyltransferase